jgi:hypothetical protein
VDANQIRAILKNTWETVLGTEVDDTINFFEAGGHSFLAIQIIASLDQSLPEPTPMAILFDHPVFGNFTDQVTKRMSSAAAS